MNRISDRSKDEYKEILSDGLAEAEVDRERSGERKKEAAKSHRSRTFSLLLTVLAIATVTSSLLYAFPSMISQEAQTNQSPPPEEVKSQLESFHQKQMAAEAGLTNKHPVVSQMISNLEPQMKGHSVGVEPKMLEAIKAELRAQGLTEEEIGAAVTTMQRRNLLS